MRIQVGRDLAVTWICSCSEGVREISVSHEVVDMSHLMVSRLERSLVRGATMLYSSRHRKRF